MIQSKIQHFFSFGVKQPKNILIWKTITPRRYHLDVVSAQLSKHIIEFIRIMLGNKSLSVLWRQQHNNYIFTVVKNINQFTLKCCQYLGLSQFATVKCIELSLDKHVLKLFKHKIQSMIFM